jgi:hypothetical protein
LHGTRGLSQNQADFEREAEMQAEILAFLNQGGTLEELKQRLGCSER